MRQQRATTAPTEDMLRRSSSITIISDIILLVAFVVCLLAYTSINNVNRYNQNVDNVSNIASANAQLMQAALDNASYEVKGAYLYCDGKNVNKILDYLSLINASGSEYQLLTRDKTVSTETYHVYSGYSTKRTGNTYTPVQYKDTALARSLYGYTAADNGAISYSPSFTNSTDAFRYFAVYCGIIAEQDGVFSEYYLVKPQKESTIIRQAQAYSQYEDLMMAICYTDGNYLARDSGFRADNFYDYLYDYNGLSVDQRNAIRASIESDSDGAGVLTYQDYQGRDCVFAYAACGGDRDWLVIAVVPEEEFVAEQMVTALPLMIIVFLVILLSFNIYRLLFIVKELRSSVYREQLASAAKTSFLSRMSHEIRTPLNAIIGYNTIARNEMVGAKNDAARKQAGMKAIDCLEKGEIASRHLLSIINDVLDMSAIASGKINIAHERFDFKGLITAITTVFYSQAKSKGVDFDVVLDTLTEEWFIGDQVRVNQILTNLLSNAIKFSSAGDTVTLRVRQPDATADAARIQFEISDTGIGMTPEYLEHIWTPFEQEDASISRRFGGTGLGLSITKNLVDLMGGSISVTSAIGVGTTFFVELTFENMEQPGRFAAYDFSTVNALVVDDDSNTCDYIRLLFSRCGARCVSFTSGAEAVKAVAAALEQGTPYTVCLVDWRMPGMDGIETVKRIHHVSNDQLPIIILTAYDYSELADQAAEVGINQFLSKPLFQSSLFDLLANLSGTDSAKPAGKKAGYDFAGARVLLAEDNAMNMEIAKHILQSNGLVIDGVWNGKEAVERFTASAPDEYAAILMDVHMPEMNGHDATRAIRQSTHPAARTIPIIAMTADAFAENVAEAHAAGMNDHIAKPIDVTNLFQTLKRYI